MTQLSLPPGVDGVSLIGAPTDVGAGMLGARMGPEALRVAGIAQAVAQFGIDVRDCGNLAGPPNPWQSAVNGFRHLPEVVAWNQLLHDAVRTELAAARLPVVMGGDHCLGIGSISAVARHCRERGRKLRVLWFDAHADFNTATLTPSGNIHGMPMAVSLGRGPVELVNIGFEGAKLSPQDVSYIGLRSVDPGEARSIHELEIEYFAMPDIDRQGVPAIIDRVLERLSGRVDHLHVSFDMDAIDPRIAPGVGTPVFGGLTYREAHLVMETLAQCPCFSSLELVEVNPVLDSVNRTAELGAELIASALGKRIL